MKKIIATDKNLRGLLKKYFEKPNNMPPLNDWDVSKVTDMSGLFKEYSDFNEPLNDWGVQLGEVKNMSSMFADCYNFDQPLNKWNVSNVENMSKMFSGSGFNQPLNDWGNNLGKVENMSSMFAGSYFNQPLNEWNVRNVEDMSSMFAESIFNQPLNDWGDKLGNVKKNMSFMFQGCLKFNQPLDNWKVNNVKNMSFMFAHCAVFNQPLNNWGDKLGNVENMSSIFEGCSKFNESLNQWLVRAGCNTDRMLDGCPIRNQPDKLPPFLRRPVVDPLQVHKASGKVEYPKLNKFFLKKIKNIENIEDIENVELSAKFIKDNLTKIINNTYAQNTHAQNTDAQNQLQQIIQQRLQSLDFGQYNDDPDFKKTICLSLLYVQQQSIEFQKTYINNFVFDCVNAYEDNGNGNVSGIVSGLSCAKGILEQIILSCNAPCTQYISSGKEEKKKEYQELSLLLNPISIQDLILEWYKEHNKEKKKDNFEKLGKTPDARREKLVKFLKSKIPEADDGEIVDVIDKFGLGYDDNDFMYGGGRKNTRRRKARKIKKAKTRKHSKTWKRYSSLRKSG